MADVSFECDNVRLIIPATMPPERLGEALGFILKNVIYTLDVKADDNQQELIAVIAQVFQYISWLSYSRDLDADEKRLLDRVRGILHRHSIVTNDLVWEGKGWPTHDLSYNALMKSTGKA